MPMRSRPSADGQVAVPLLELYGQDDLSPGATSHGPQRQQDERVHGLNEAQPIHDNSWRPPSSRFKDYLTILLPSFIRYRYFKEADAPSPFGQWHSTVFLDGLRGVACMTVFHLHILNLLDKWHWDGWGVYEHDDKIIQMPLIRLIYSGNLAVHVFFVISGFALSVSVVKLMQAEHRDIGAFGKILTSSIFRRPIRLFPPAWASTVPPFFYYQLGIYNALEPIRTSKVFDGWPKEHIANDTLRLQIQDFILEDMRMLNIFTLAPHNRYNGPTWTIPVEFRASLVLYLTHAALFGMQRKFRLPIVVFAMFVALAFEQTDVPLFWAGFILAEVFFLRSQNEQFGFKTSPISPSKNAVKVCLTTAFFILSLWIGTFPEHMGRESPGYIWLATFKPPNTFTSPEWWRIVGSIGIVGTLVFCPDSSDVISDTLLSRFSRAPKAFLTSPICRYLGKISYGLYLTQYLVLDTFGIVCFYSVFSITGMENSFMYYLGFIISYVLTLGAAIWLGDLFWRFVDQPCVNFAKWLEKRLSAS